MRAPLRTGLAFALAVQDRVYRYATVAGGVTDAVTLVPAPPAGGVTREQEDFSDVRLDPGPTPADFG